MTTDPPVPRLTQEEIERMAREYTTLDNIACKLWWGWIPRFRARQWYIPFEHDTKRMTEEEAQWFRRH